MSVEVKKYVGQDDYHRKLSKKFKLDNKYDHTIIESCRFLLEDTEQAIQHFEDFGLQGPTRYTNNFDERYLRLYGFLNAINLQKSVLITLTDVFKLGIRNKLKKELARLKIIEFRHKAGAHSLDYKDADQVSDYFRLSQTTLSADGVGITIISRNGYEEIDLRRELEEYRKVFHRAMLEVFENVTKKMFPDGGRRGNAIISYLELIRLKINGDIVSMGPNGEYIVLSSKEEFSYPGKLKEN